MKLVTQRGAKQEYQDDDTGQTFYSVTQVRRVAHDAYAGIPEAQLEPARVRGTLLHRRFFFACASLEGLCPYPAIIPSYDGYCRSMDRWIEKRKPKRIKLETPSYNPRYGYAGTPDALLEILLPVKARLSRIRRVLMDLKTGGPVRSDPMQLCAYEKMDDYKAEDLLDVYLNEDGFEARERFVTKGERATEFSAFLNALALLKWRNGK